MQKRIYQVGVFLVAFQIIVMIQSVKAQTMPVIPQDTQNTTIAITVLMEWYKTHTVISALVIAMVGDVLTGVGAAAIQRKVNSSIAFDGMIKKACMMVLVGVCAALQPLTPGQIPFGQIVAGFFAVVETISITENMAAMGVPLPSWLTDILAKMKDKDPVKPLPDPQQQPFYVEKKETVYMLPDPPHRDTDSRSRSSDAVPPTTTEGVVLTPNVTTPAPDTTPAPSTDTPTDAA